MHRVAPTASPTPASTRRGRGLVRYARIHLSLALALAVAVGALAAPAIAWAQDSSINSADPLAAALEALALGEHDKAEAALKAHIENNSSDARAHLYLARTYAAAGEHDAAVAAYRAYVTKFPEDAAVVRANFELADSLHALGKTADVLAIYAEMAHRLTTVEARHDLARRYVREGDRLFDGVSTPDPLIPSRTTTTYDFPRAAQLYSTALSIGLPAGETVRALERQAVAFQRSNAFAPAADAFTKLARHDAANESQRQRAELGAAECAMQAGTLNDAARALTHILDAGREHAGYVDALLLAARVYASNGWDVDKGISYAERFIKEFGSDPRRDEWNLWIARQEVMHGRYVGATERLRAMVSRTNEPGNAADARFLLAQAFEAAGQYDDAIRAYATFAENHRSDPRVNAADNSQVRLTWEAAVALSRANKLDDADEAWLTFVDRFPYHPHAVAALWHHANIEEQRGQYMKAIDAYREVAARGANVQDPMTGRRISPIAATRRIAYIAEVNLQDYARAIDEYRYLQSQLGDHQAASELARLTSPALSLYTPHAARTTEEATMVVTTRNITALTVRAYTLDFLEYFRRKWSTVGVENLMVDVLRPDKSTNVPVEEYADYRELTSKFALPVDSAGAYVITCFDENYRGTTLALVSDLELVVKTSRDQCVVLAMNARTGSPWSGVTLRLHTGNKNAPVLERTTDANGFAVFGRTLAGTDIDGDRANYTQVKIFASAEVGSTNGGEAAQHYAFYGFDPASDFQNFAYQPRLYGLTDRPLYRAGETVQYTFTVRDVRNGAYAVPIASHRDVTVHAKLPSGQVFATSKARLDDDGVVSGSFLLDSDAPSGTYTIVLDTRYQGDGTTNFEVRPFTRPDFELSVRFDRPLYTDAQTAKLTIQARRYTGAPVTNQALSVTVAELAAYYTPTDPVGARWYFPERQVSDNSNIYPDTVLFSGNVTTDDKGNATVEVPLDRGLMPRGNMYPRVIAQVSGVSETGRTVSSAGISAVVSRAVMAVAAPQRPVVRAGLKAGLLVVTEDPMNRPVQVGGTMLVFEGDKRNEWDESAAMMRVPCTTGRNGRGLGEVKLDRPGQYTLVFVGSANYADTTTRVSAAAMVNVVSPDQDGQDALLVLADKDVYYVGETARLTVISPITVANALLTVEGETVLSARTIAIDRREITIDVPLTQQYMPNVRVSLSAIDAQRHRLLTGETELHILKLLNIAVETDKAEYAPGEEITVTIKTTDQLGRGTSARVALGVIDEFIYDLEPDATPDIRARFYNFLRPLVVRTGASVNWRYDGIVAVSDPDLLAEQALREALKDNLRAESEQLERQNRSLDMDAPDARPSANAAEPAMPGDAGGEGWGASGGMHSRRARGGGGRAMDDEAGAMLLQIENAMMLRKNFALTAGWYPDIRTDENGNATITFTLPDSITSWRLTAHGVTRDTAVGEQRTSVKTTMSYYATMDVPRVATEGDKFAVPVILHNETDAATKANAVITTGDGQTEAAVDVDKQSVARTDAWTTARFGADEETTRVAVTAGFGGGNTDMLQQDFRVRPFGAPYRVGFADTLGETKRMRFDVPEGAVPATYELEVTVTPTLEDAILDGLIYLDQYPYGCIEQTVNRYFPALAAFNAVASLQRREPNLYAKLKDIVTVGINRVATLQNGDGGWGWWSGNASNPDLTSLVFESLVIARQLDFDVPDQTINRSRQLLRSLLANSERSTSPQGVAMYRGIMLYALAAERGVSLRSELDRYRSQALQGPTTDLARFIIACVNTNNRDLATAAIADLANRAVRPTHDTAMWKVDDNSAIPMQRNQIDVTGLALRALALAGHDKSLQRAAVSWLLAQRHGGKWYATRDTAVVIAAFTDYLRAGGGQTVEAPRISDVSIQLDNKTVATVRIDRDDRRTHTIKLGADKLGELEKGSHTLSLIQNSTAEVPYTVVFTSMVRPSDPNASIQPRSTELAVERKLVQNPNDPRWRLAGNSPLEVSRDAVQRMTMEVKELAPGEVAQVRLTVRASKTETYLMLEDPFPVGVEVVPGSNRGSYVSRFEVREGKTCWFFEQLPAGETTLTYLVRAYRPGTYRATPSIASRMYEPMVWGSSSDLRLAVLTLKQAAERVIEETDVDRATRLLVSARDAAAKGDDETARKAYTDLLGFDTLKTSIRREAFDWLFRLGVRTTDFGLVRTAVDGLAAIGLSPSNMSALDYVTVGDAYRDVRGDVSLMAFRNAVDMWNNRVTVAIGMSADAERRVTEQAQQLNEMPASLTEAQMAWDWCTAARNAAQPEESMAVYLDSVRTFAATHTTGFWNRRALDELAVTLIGSNRFDEAKAFTARATKALPRESEPLADNMRYYLSVACVALGDLDDAREHAEALLQEGWLNESGIRRNDQRFYFMNSAERTDRARRGYRTGVSQYAPNAYHVLGQIAEAQGRLADAVENYSHARSSFADAQAAHALLTEVRFRVPTVITATNAEIEAADPELEIEAKNVSAVHVAIYPIDLLYGFTQRKHLNNLETLDLTGLSPEMSFDVELTGGSYREFTQAVPLRGLATGAYLVLVSTPDAVKSTLVLISDLKADAVVTPAGSVRVTVTWDGDDKPARGAYVKASNGRSIVDTGFTDLRGVYTCGNAREGAAILVELDGHYALIPAARRSGQ